MNRPERLTRAALELVIPDFLREFVEPWYASLRDPLASQENVLHDLVDGYAKTEYGQRFRADRLESVAEFQKSFPVVDYELLRPEIEKVVRGEFRALLPEPVSRWVMTRGSTGAPKLVPCTDTHLAMILAVGARALINYASRHPDTRILERKVLNLNFPSEVTRLKKEDGGGALYGYSSGTYARMHPELGPASLVPRQEKIDSLGGGILREDWERRFELAYQDARNEDVGCVMGVAPVMLQFGTYLRKRHRTAPRDLWKMDALFCTSVAKIQSKYAPILRRLYGRVPVVEMYTATEGVFAQQLDDLPYVSPNYDSYFFEVKTAEGMTTPLHDLRAGQWGSVVVSTPLFARYEIGDLIESFGKGYFRVFGRNNSVLTVIQHRLFKTLTLRF